MNRASGSGAARCAALTSNHRWSNCRTRRGEPFPLVYQDPVRRPHDDPGIFDRRQQRENELPGRVGIVPVSGPAFIAVRERGFVAMMSVGDEERPVREGGR